MRKLTMRKAEAEGWKRRCQTAEAELERLREALRKVFAIMGTTNWSALPFKQQNEWLSLEEEIRQLLRGLSTAEAAAALGADSPEKLMNTQQEKLKDEQMKIRPEDRAFYQQLHDYAAKSQETSDPIVPLFWEADGRIDREKTLGLPCFAEFVPRRGIGRSVSCERR